MINHGAPEPAPGPADPHDLTSFHVRRATAGDGGSRTWIVERLTPLLICQAELRLPASLRRHVDPEDVVAEAWAVALSKLESIEPRGGRCTPVLLAFLGKTLLYIVNNLIRKHIAGKPTVVPVAEGNDSREGSSGAVLAAEVTDVVRRAQRHEASTKAIACLRALEAADQEIVVLRHLEGLSNGQAAAHLGILPNAAQMRLARAIARLRGMISGSVFDELDEEG